MKLYYVDSMPTDREKLPPKFMKGDSVQCTDNTFWLCLAGGDHESALFLRFEIEVPSE